MATSPLLCGNCGAHNAPHEHFCETCGYALAETTPIVASSIPLVQAITTATDQLPARTLLKQRYLILRVVGRGGMGAVYMAQDMQLGDRLVAVKEIGQANESNQSMQEAIANFKNEAHLLAGLQHPNLPSIHDYFAEAERWYLVMSFIEGETLEDYLQQAQGQKLSLAETLRLGLTLCDVLNYLHTHQPPIIFRDLKPSNIMRSADEHLYLIDFGIARHFKPGQAKDTASYGSMGYAPPEQYGKAQTTERADIYSLGVTLYECLSGYDPTQSPFNLPPLQDLVPTLPKQLVALITQMLEMNESRRPANVKVVEQTLQSISTDIPLTQMQSARVLLPKQLTSAPQPSPARLPSLPMEQIQQQSYAAPQMQIQIHTSHPQLARAQARIQAQLIQAQALDQKNLARTRANIALQQQTWSRKEPSRAGMNGGVLLAGIALFVLLVSGIGDLKNWATFGCIFFLGVLMFMYARIRVFPTPLPKRRKIESFIGKCIAMLALLYGFAVFIGSSIYMAPYVNTPSGDMSGTIVTMMVTWLFTCSMIIYYSALIQNEEVFQNAIAKAQTKAAKAQAKREARAQQKLAKLAKKYHVAN